MQIFDIVILERLVPLSPTFEQPKLVYALSIVTF
jgi:hypothetical protein